MPSRTIVRSLALSSMLPLLASGAFAREVCTPVGDPDFTGAVLVDLTPAGRPLNDFTGAPLSLNDFVYEFTQSGVTFRFESHGLDSVGWPDNQAVYSWGVAVQPSLTLTINPPVTAIGFDSRREDGCGGGSFAGAGPPPTSQDATVASCTGTCPPTAFFGAAGIGPISAVDLTQAHSLYAITSMLFQPPSVLPTSSSDLSVQKTEASGIRFVLNGDPIRYEIDVANAGPDNAPNMLAADFLPAGIFDNATHNGLGTDSFDAATDVYSLLEDPLLSQDSVHISIDATVTPDPRLFSCNDKLTNGVLVGSDSGDPDLANNLALFTVWFDRVAVAGLPEVCGDGIDNNCDGRTDCADPVCGCFPTLSQLAGGNCGGGPFGGLQAGLISLGFVSGGGCSPTALPAPRHVCRAPRGQCGTVIVPSFCCDAATWSNPSHNLDLSACNLQVPGCVPRHSGGLPVDPNFKEADPGTNPLGYGYTQAGRTMTYTLHYENVGTADALDVLVLDVLDPDLDDTTLVINDGGSYDPATRTLTWVDPVVPPAQPRQVSYRIDVRADALPGTRVRNSGTIIFPNAEPPSRIDTNFVEHVVPEPSLVIEPQLSVLGCTETAPGSGEWTVQLVNDGPGFAYNATATLVDPPSSVSVSDGAALFSHPDDPADGSTRSVIPLATTDSEDTVVFTTTTPEDPCDALVWRIEYEDLVGGFFSNDVQREPDPDLDAVGSRKDNCPDTFNPEQADGDQDGHGDACDLCPDSSAGAEVDGDGCAPAEMDADQDGVLDTVDLCPDTTLPDVPTRGLGVNRFADIDADGIFETVSPPGHGPEHSFTLDETGGCSCAQIIDGLHLGRGHERFGCSLGAMKRWIRLVGGDDEEHHHGECRPGEDGEHGDGHGDRHGNGHHGDGHEDGHGEDDDGHCGDDSHGG